jgi:amidase
MKQDIENLLVTGSIADIQAAYQTRSLSVAEALGFYLRRIEALNRRSPAINAVRMLVPDASAAARSADEQLAAGRTMGPLFGIPVLFKDNILTGDGMTATAGAAALQSFVPRRAATLVQRLRQSGAIILGKTNMTEFADYVSDVMPSEFSGAGGVVRNPHGVRYDRGQGSSVGSAAAVAAGLVPVAIGSETQNSIQTPASVSSVYGFKPTVGRVSRAGIVPLVPSQDSPGPLARSVADIALVLSVLDGPDVRDSATLSAAHDSVPALSVWRIGDVTIGVPRKTIADRADLAAMMPLFEGVLARLGRAGAVIRDPCDVPSAEQLQEVRSSVFRTEFKAALNEFLTDHGAPAGIGSLADLIAWNERHAEAIPYGQSLLLAAEQTSGLDDAQYRADRARDIALSRLAGIDAALSTGPDVLIVPMAAAAKWTGKAGAPVLAIPTGIAASGQPFGVTLIGRCGDDRRLLAIGSTIAAIIGERVLPRV